MAVVGVDSGRLQADSQPKSSGLVLGRRSLGAVLHSSSEPGEQHHKHCLGIIIIFIIIIKGCGCGEMGSFALSH